MGEVHVYRCFLDRWRPAGAALESVLSDAERARAGRRRFERDRIRFVVARGVLRTILSYYLGIEPARIPLGQGPWGKPCVCDEDGRALGRRAAGFDFNVSHADDLALFSVSRAGAVGVDVERVRSVPELASLVLAHFRRREAEVLLESERADRERDFLRCWTSKEALLKATGRGISGGLLGFEVLVASGAPARLVGCPSGFGKPADWSLIELRPAPGRVGASAVWGPLDRLRCWTWPGEPGGDSIAVE